MRLVLTTLLSCASLMASNPARAQPVMENLGRGVVVVRSARAIRLRRLAAARNRSRRRRLQPLSSRGLRASRRRLNKVAADEDHGLRGHDARSVRREHATRCARSSEGRSSAASAPFVLPANAPIQQFLTVPLQRPAGGEAPGPSGAPARLHLQRQRRQRRRSRRRRRVRDRPQVGSLELARHGVARRVRAT